MKQLVRELVDNLLYQAEAYQKVIEMTENQILYVQGDRFPVEMNPFLEQMALQKDCLARIEEWRQSASQMEHRLAEQLGVPEIRLSLLQEVMSRDEYQQIAQAVTALSQAIGAVTMAYERLDNEIREKTRNLGIGRSKGAISSQTVTSAYKSNQTSSAKSPNSDKSTLLDSE